MEFYFGDTSNIIFPFLGIGHIILILVTFTSVYLIYKYRNKIKNSVYIDRFICGVLLLNQLVYLTGAILTDNFSIQTHLPLHYCYILGYVYCYMLLFKKEKLFDFVYYAVFFCTLSVIIFQDTLIGPDRFDFVLLVISHHFLFISLFYVLFVKKYLVTKKGMFKMISYSLFIYGIVFIINQILGTNYIYSDSFPSFLYDILPFLYLMHPLIWMLLFTIPIFLIARYFIYLSTLKEENKYVQFIYKILKLNKS